MNTEAPVFVRNSIRQLQLVVLALASGVLVFVAVVIFLRQNGQFAVGGPPFEMLAYAGLALLATSIPLQAVLLPLLDQMNCKRIDMQSDDTQPWISAFTSRTIAGCAIIEGAAFFCIIGAMLSGQPWGLIAAAVAAMVMIVLFLPNIPRFDAFVERQKNFAVS